MWLLLPEICMQAWFDLFGMRRPAAPPKDPQ
ncbi:hypothetical protein H4CHR_03005 [Variovorax sp. PBS-H4]|nr:hypothetical protein H4CHR_03005 [Variovorax sp. PBS-H4]